MMQKPKRKMDSKKKKLQKIHLPATFFAGTNFPVLDIYARPEFLKCFCNLFLERDIFLSMPGNAADTVAILILWRSQ